MFDSYHDSDKGFAFCFQAQDYFESQGSKTKVLAASLTSIEEVMQLAGVHHITISPPLLAELAATTADGWKNQGVLGRELNHASEAIPLDESAWRMAFTRSKAGKNEEDHPGNQHLRGYARSAGEYGQEVPRSRLATRVPVSRVKMMGNIDCS